MISITRYRVWPDGAVQEADTPAHHWKSDDYELVEAPAPEDAWARAKANAPMVPELNYAAICDAAFLQDKRWAQGTTGCVAFARGAEWYRDQLLAKGPHTLYKTNDPEAPATIRDRNGEVVLSLCKVCGKAEGELGEPCHAPAVPQGEPLTIQEQQKEWADYFNRCDSYDLPDRRHAFLAGLSRGLKIAATARAPAPSKGAVGFGARALAAELAEAALKDDNDPEGHDISAGLFGPNVSAWLRKVASEYLAPAHAPAQEQCNACLGTGRMVRDPDIGTDQECFVCDGSGYEPEQEVGLTDEAQATPIPCAVTVGATVFEAGTPFCDVVDKALTDIEKARSLLAQAADKLDDSGNTSNAALLKAIDNFLGK